MTRGDKRALALLAAELDEWSDGLGARLRHDPWWRRPGFIRAASVMAPFGAVAVFEATREADA